MNKKTIRDMEVKGKRVLVRVDFNVPMDDRGNITDDTRIRAAVPTIQYLAQQGAKVVLASHPGRPKGQRNEKYSLAPAASRLAELLGREVRQAPDCIGPEVQALVDAMQPGDLVMLENVRFYAEEENNDPGFAQKMASLPTFT